MRKTFVISALLAMLAIGAAQAFAQTATVVTHSGQRIRGQLIDRGNYGDLTVRVNGREQRIPIGDVAVVDFVGDGRNIPPSESARANQNYDGMVVLRNGRTIVGRPDMQLSSNQAVVATNSGLRNIGLNQVARVYFGPTDGSAYNRYGRDQYPNNGPYYDQNGNNGNYGQYGNDRYGNYGQNGNYGQYGQPVYGNTNRTVTVPTNQQWTNSGLDVQRGETIHFRARGNVMLSQNANDYGTPAGANDGRMAGNSPLPGVTGGMLIGRVNNGQPFVIGAENDVTMPANGRLYLGVNDDYVGDNQGNFTVETWRR